MTTAEVLPQGNQWEFSERNFDPSYRPAPRTIEITQPTGVLKQIVDDVQTRFIKEGWQFAAVIEDLEYVEDEGSAGLNLIFTHPLRNALSSVTAVVGFDDLLKVDPEDSELPLDDPINQMLVGTNWAAHGFGAHYNTIQVEKRTPSDAGVLYQTGVGIFGIGLSTLESRISAVNGQIDELMKEVHPLEEEKATLLSLQVPEPTQLFTTN